MAGLASTPESNTQHDDSVSAATAGASSACLPEFATMEWVKQFHKQLVDASWKPLHALRETLPAQTAIRLLSATKALLALEPTLVQVFTMSTRIL
jgi:hypothetical protein